MKIKTSKELLGTIYYKDAQKRVNHHRGIDSLVAWYDNNAYIIGCEMGSDFHTISEFLKYRIRLIGFEKFTHEIDLTEFDFIAELLDVIENGLTSDYLGEIMQEVYQMEDLSQC